MFPSWKIEALAWVRAKDPDKIKHGLVPEMSMWNFHICEVQDKQSSDVYASRATNVNIVYILHLGASDHSNQQ